MKMGSKIILTKAAYPSHAGQFAIITDPNHAETERCLYVRYKLTDTSEISYVARSTDFIVLDSLTPAEVEQIERLVKAGAYR